MSSKSKLLQYLLLFMLTLALAQQTPSNVTNVTSTTSVVPPSTSTTTTTSAPNTTATSTSTTTPTKTTNTTSTTTPNKTTKSTTVVKHVKPVVHKFTGEVLPYEICLDGADNSFVAFNPKVGDFGVRNFTVAIWIQTNETLPLFDIVGNRNESGQGNYFQMRMSGANNPTMPAGQVLVELDQNATGFNYANLTSNTTGLNDGNWHYLVFVRNGLNLSLYVNGKLDNSVTTTGVANITNPVEFKIGRSVEAVAGPRFAPVACFADLRVYKRALTAIQIAKLFAVQATVY